MFFLVMVLVGFSMPPLFSDKHEVGGHRRLKGVLPRAHALLFLRGEAPPLLPASGRSCKLWVEHRLRALVEQW